MKIIGLVVALLLSSSALARSPRPDAPVPAQLQRAPVRGDAVRVSWGGSWWDGHVIDVRDDLFKITYDGWDASWDEWVEIERLAPPRTPIDLGRLRVGDAVSVEWGGQWWDAHVLSLRKGEALINYDGYDASWDEWVGPGRLRARE